MNKKLELFLTSFLVLFLELSLIRLLPAQVAYLGFYANFILLASFVGMGGGIMLAQKKGDLRWFFPWILFSLIFLAGAFPISIYPDSSGEIHFSSTFRGLVFPEFLFVPLVFGLTALVFVGLTQQMGRLFNQMKPLEAYKWDILGSLTGVLVFSLLSYLRLPPGVWFGIFAAVWWAVWGENTRRGWVAAGLLLGVVTLTTLASIGAYWSPYQKVNVYKGKTKSGGVAYSIFVNNIGHQTVAADVRDMQWFYSFPYKIFNNAKFDRVLVIGAGSGTDVAMALTQQVKRIDAVEIDPQILDIGKTIRPNGPYSDPRVKTYVEDARTFMERSKDKYDLIVFGLPDSLVLASARGNIRLESFLFTLEAFRQARNHLNPDGAIVLYNYYRQPWLAAKLAGMLTQVFGNKTYVYGGMDQQYSAVLVNGGRLAELRTDVPRPIEVQRGFLPATDDWPFVYSQKPGMPVWYTLILTGLAIGVYFSLSAFLGKPLYKNIEPKHFFLGAAFLLLETKSVVQFSLLFGATWLVNALVIGAILVSVFLATLLVDKIKIKNLTHWYLGLAMALLVQYLFPLSKLLGLPDAAKYLVVSGLTFLPIFLANVIFSSVFSQSKYNSINFASNILGAAAGGMLEYSALVIGYRGLVLVAGACYLLAFVIPMRRGWDSNPR